MFPLLLLAFGYGEAARVGAVAYAAFLVITLHTAASGTSAIPEQADLLAALGATRWQIARWVRVFEALPHALTGWGIHRAVSAGIVVAVVTEMIVGASHGLGGHFAGKLLLRLERTLLYWRD